MQGTRLPWLNVKQNVKQNIPPTARSILPDNDTIFGHLCSSWDLIPHVSCRDSAVSSKLEKELDVQGDMLGSIDDPTEQDKDVCIFLASISEYSLLLKVQFDGECTMPTLTLDKCHHFVLCSKASVDNPDCSLFYVSQGQRQVVCDSCCESIRAKYQQEKRN